MKKEITKRYCEKCGKEMNIIEFSRGFDRYTGKEKLWVKYICPELDWDKLLTEPMFNIFAETYFGHYYFDEKLD